MAPADQRYGGMDRYDGLSSSEVLAGIRGDLAAARDLEVEQFRGIVAWADRNTIGDDDGLESPENTAAATAWAGFCDTGLPIAGAGAPLVSEFALAELIAVLGRSPDSGRSHVGRCIELGWRLPQTCDRVLSGQVRLWKALEVADLTRSLSAEAATYVDRNIAFALASCTWAQVRRLVEEAVARFDPEAAEQARQAASEDRCFNVHVDRATEHGLVEIDAVLDAADAVDLDKAIARRAAALGQLGNDESLSVRRALAAGEVARADLLLDLEVVDRETGEVTTVAKARRVILHVHLSHAALTGATGGEVGRCEETKSPISPEQIKAWCAMPGTAVSVRPVIDLHAHVPVDSYEIPDRLRAHVALRDHHCAFPYCARQARSCDVDHHEPYAEGGSTCPCNLVALCRRHHRLKTHTNQLTGWNYTIVDTGTYLWRSPNGHAWLVDHRGTRDLDPGRALDPIGSPRDVAVGLGAGPP